MKGSRLIALVLFDIQSRVVDEAAIMNISSGSERKFTYRGAM
jgi:hypothetical protein